MKKADKKNEFTRYLAFQVIFPVIGGFLFGYDTGVISGVILFIRKYFNLSTFMQEIVVSATIFSCVFSSLLGGILADKIGRRKALIISSVMLMIGSLLMGAATFVEVLILGRVFVGVGIGLAATCCPIYVSEVSPEQIRGRLVLLYDLSITAGQLIASIIDALLFTIGDNAWRYMLAAAIVPALVQLIGLIFIPESHRWLISKDRIAEAKTVIIKEKRVPEDQIDQYIETIVKSHRDTEHQISQHKVGDGTILFQIFRDSLARRTLLIGCCLQMFQQLVGINTVMYYSATVIRMAGTKDISTILWLAAVLAFFNFIPSIIGFNLIDRIGRRKLILCSLIGVFLSLIMLAITFQISQVQSEPVQFRDLSLTHPDDILCGGKKTCDECISSQLCGFCYSPSSSNITVGRNSTCLASHARFSDYSDRGWCSNKSITDQPLGPQWLNDHCTWKYSWLIILAMILYLLFFTVGMGPVPWAVTSEIYPLWCRGTNMAISTSTNWTFSLIISLTFLSLTEWITKHGTFWLLSGFALFGIAFIYKFLPETNQQTLEEITVLVVTK